MGWGWKRMCEYTEWEVNEIPRGCCWEMYGTLQQWCYTIVFCIYLVQQPTLPGTFIQSTNLSRERIINTKEIQMCL